MATITSATVKRLFARCQNRCAFPSCEAPIIEDSDTVTGDICHIKAASVGGPRYDASQTDEARHGAANLILLCTRHHRIVDADIEKHTTSVLIEMKRKHEQGGVVEITPRTARAAESLLAHYAEVTVYSNSGQIAVNKSGCCSSEHANPQGLKAKSDFHGTFRKHWQRPSEDFLYCLSDWSVPGVPERTRQQD